MNDSGMKQKHLCRLPLLAVLVIFSVKISAQSPVDSSRVLRILTYNIFHGETMKGDFDLDRIAGVIKSTDPDLVALQEVDFFTRRARHMDLATELGQRCGLAPLFGRAMPFDGGAYGEGVLSRYSFLSTRNHMLGAGPGKEPRAALEVYLVLHSGDTIRFIGTHLDHTRDETDRINQAIQLNSFFTNDEMPSILAGDLNAKPESQTMDILFSEWTSSSTNSAPTFPSVNPVKKIDFVLFRPENRWRVLESSVIADSVASDHCALLSVLELLCE
jgi:endonuclease/exonuclease/phosphatase family metal-dependent hydrolase